VTARTIVAGPGRVKVLAEPAAALWLLLAAIDGAALWGLAELIAGVTR